MKAPTLKYKSGEFTKTTKKNLILYLIYAVKRQAKHGQAEYMCHILQGSFDYDRIIPYCSTSGFEETFPEFYGELQAYCDRQNKNVTDDSVATMLAPFNSTDTKNRLDVLKRTLKRLG